LSRSNPTKRSAAIIYGVHPVTETLKAGRRLIEKVFLGTDRSVGKHFHELIEAKGVKVIRRTNEELDAITGSQNHQGVAARVGHFPYVAFEDLLSLGHGPSCILLLLDGVQDPSNLGSILRCADCMGALGIVLTTDRSVQVTPVVEKASAGAAAHIPIAQVVNLTRAIESLKQQGFWIYCADPSGMSVYETDLKGRVAIVLGSEGKGVRRLVKENSDQIISIPMRGRVSSLNVAQSAAIILSEAQRRFFSAGIETCNNE
jgi:23S rRNA (guanosine2251-2'-O)-methyltransferase